MIEIPQPSIALNAKDAHAPDKDYNVPGTKYEMSETWDVPINASADWIMAFTSILANKFENGVKCLVINCHGKYGYGTNRFGNKRLIDTGGFGLRLGQGIYLADTEKFSQLKGLVKCIVITACGVAQVTNDGKNTGNGAYFCSQIARAANAYVVAPIILQAPAHYKLSKNHIDNFEGEVVRYNPSGALDDSRFLGRKLIHDIF